MSTIRSVSSVIAAGAGCIHTLPMGCMQYFTDPTGLGNAFEFHAERLPSLAVNCCSKRTALSPSHSGLCIARRVPLLVLVSESPSCPSPDKTTRGRLCSVYAVGRSSMMRSIIPSCSTIHHTTVNARRYSARLQANRGFGDRPRARLRYGDWQRQELLRPWSGVSSATASRQATDSRLGCAPQPLSLPTNNNQDTRAEHHQPQRKA